MKLVKVDRGQVRGVTYLSNGTRFESFLPHGVWGVVGDCYLATPGVHPSNRTHAKLYAPSQGFWYVAADAAAALPEVDAPLT
jgi:hypothetical protein